MGDKLLLKGKMDETRLIQRLYKPTGTINPFSFGAAGLKNGGFSDKAMAVLKEIFSFDYMGAAEFEWGRIPAVFDFIAQEARKGKVVTGVHEGVYYICPKSYKSGVEATIDSLLEDESTMNLKEGCGLKYTMNPRRDHEDERNVNFGWIELNNGYFFFADPEMFEATKRLFGV